MLFLLSAAVSLTGQTYVKSFPSGGTLPDGGACNYSTNKCYIVNQGTGTITVIRGSANFADTAPPATPPPSPILSTIALTSTPNPMGIAVNPVTNMIYVASSTAGSIAVIDGATDTLSTTLAVPAASGLRVVAADPVNNYIYAANTSASGSLIVVNGTTNAVTSVAAGTNSYGVAVDPVNHEVYVTNQGSSSVSVFSGATASSPTVALITTISGGTSGLDAPQNLDINPVTNTVYVQNTGVTGLLTIINGADHSATSFAVSLTGSTGIAVDPVTGMVFTDNAAGAIRFDGTTATPLGVPGHRPTVNSQTGQVYFEGSDNNVYVYNQTGTVGVVTLSPGQVGPLNAVLNPAANTVFVTNATSNTVSLIRGFRFVNVSGSPIAVSAGPVVEPYSPQTTFVTVNGVTKAYVESNTNPAVDMITMPTAPGGPITRLQIALSNYGAGCNPTSLRLSPAANKAYFRVTCGANTPGQGGVAYINTSNDTYGGTIFPAPPTQYVAGMEVNPVTDSVFALLKNAAGASQLVVIKSGVAGTPIPLGTNASNAFGVDTAYDRVYVAEYPASTGTLRVLDGNLGFITTVPLPAALTQPNRVQVSPYTHKIYVGSGNTNQIGIVDPTATPPYQNPISIPLLGTTAQPWTFIVFDPSGYAYALQRAARLVSAIRESDNTRISTPAAPALTILPAAATTAGSPCDEPISHTVYVPSGSATAGRIYLIDAMTGQSPPGNGSLSPDATPGGFFLVGSGGTASTTPSNCNITPDGQYLIVSNIGDNTVSVVDLRINQAVPLKVTSAGDDTKDTLYVSGPSVSGPGTGNAIYTTRNQFPPFSVSVTSDYTGLSVPGYNSGTDPLPTAIYYNVDALTAMRAATTPTAGPGTTTVTFEADLSPGSPAAAPLRAGVHYLHIYAAYGDEARMDEFASGPHLGLVATQQFLVAPIPTTTTVTSDVNPQNVSGTVVFTATVTPAFAPLEGSTLPTGGVQFCDGPCTGTNLLGTGTLGTPDPATGAATATLSVTSVATTGPLAAGSHNINAYYEGDLSYESSVGTLTQIISGPATAVVPTAASSPQSVEFPNPFVLNATVEDALGNPVPNAPVDLSSTDGLLFSTSPTGPFTATLSLTSGTDGTMPTVYAKAPGLGTFSATAESDSATPADFTDLTVTPATASSSLLTVNGGASATVSYGDAVTLVDAITPVPPPGDLGTVSFYDGGACAAGVCTGTLLGTVNIASDGSGTATLATTALHVGSGAHTILAQYIGSSTVPETASNTVTVTVNPYSLPASECTTPIQPENVCPALIAIPKPGGRLTTALDSTVYPAAGFTLALAPGASFFNGDTATSITITGTPVFTVTPPDSTAVGVYPVTLSGISTADYLIGFEPGQLSVTSTPTTTQLTVSPNPSVYGQPVTLTATVPELPAGWTGSVNLYDGPTLLCTANVINGVATCTSSSIPAGAHNLTATYDGDQTFAASTSTPVAMTVTPATAPGGGPALIVTVLDASRVFGEPNPQFVYSCELATGAQFYNGDTCATALTGVVQYTTAANATTPLSPPTVPVSIVQSSLTSQNYTVQYVDGNLTIVSIPTTTAITSVTPNPSDFGTAVTLTAMVTSTTSTLPTGPVAFTCGQVLAGTATVNGGGVATLVLDGTANPFLPAGDCTLTATYLGDDNTALSASAPTDVTVNKAPGTLGPDANAALLVTVNNVSRPYGQANPQFTVTPTGTLVPPDTYQTAIKGAALYETTATSSSPVGAYPVAIASSLTSPNYALAFAPGTLTIVQAHTGENGQPSSDGTPGLMLTVSPSPSTVGEEVTITTTVPTGATGTIAFENNGVPIPGCEAVPIPQGASTVTCTTTDLPVGPDNITAVYSGDTNYTGATSNAVTQTVSPGDFTIAVTPLTQSVLPGTPASFTVHLAGTTGPFDCPVTLSTSSSPALPAGSTVTFATNPVTPGTAIDVIMKVTVPPHGAVAGLNTRAFRTKVPMALALLLLPLAAWRRRRSWGLLLLTLVAELAVSSAAIVGCSPGGYFSQPAATYQITVTGTADCGAGGTFTHSILPPISLTVGL